MSGRGGGKRKVAGKRCGYLISFWPVRDPGRDLDQYTSNWQISHENLKIWGTGATAAENWRSSEK